MRHRLANKSLSRPTAHRLLMLRNLVSSLLQHESITTTLTKAKETQKLAEKVIGWGKKGGKCNYDRAQAWLLNPNDTMLPLFTTFASRYSTRPGGYTRIHRVGHRVGDNAPLAVLELVDSPNDLKYESTARIVGREMAIRAKEGAGPEGWWKFRGRVEKGEKGEVDLGGEENVIERIGKAFELDSLTRKNCVKVLRYRVEQSIETLVPGSEAEELDSTTPSISSFSNSTSTPTPEADESPLPLTPSDSLLSLSPSIPILSPTTEFLNLTHNHYLRSLATLSLSLTPTLDPLKSLKQLSSRLNPNDERGPPKQVYTLPRMGRVPKAGERTDGWGEIDETLWAEGGGETSSSYSSSKVEVGSKRGGPIGRAKGSRGREGRRQEWTGTKRSQEELAGAEL